MAAPGRTGVRAWLVLLVLAGCLSPASPPPPAAGDEPAAPNPSEILREAARVGGGFSRTDVFPGSYDPEALLSRVAQPGPHAILEPEVVLVESAADGVAIEIGLARPAVANGTRVPVIVVASPYFVPLTPARMKGEDRPEGALPHTWIHYQYLAENFVPHGYAIALVSVRGSAGSGGCMDLFGPLEQADLDQAVTWLGTREWSSGNVGMYGLSYSASTPWEVAALGNPHLKTIVPVAGLPDIFHFLYYNGSVHAGAFGGLPLTYWPFAWVWDDPTGGGDASAFAEGVACAELPRGLATNAASAFTLAPDAVGFFAPRDHRPGVEARYNGSIFLVQGLEDWRVPGKNSYPWIHELEAKGLTVKHLLGPWPHAFPDGKSAGESRRLDFAEILLHWFDFWLKEDRAVDLGPRVQVQDTEGRWRSEDDWPPRDATSVTLHLAAGGALAAAAGGEGEPVAVGADPRRVATPLDPLLNNAGVAVPTGALRCDACASFSTEAAAAPLRVVGQPVATLTVTPTGPGGHVTVHLLAGERVIGRGMLDLRLAQGDDVDTPTPGTPLVARVLLEPMDAVVPAGAALTLVVHQGGYEEKMGATPTYPVRLAVGGGASYLTFLTVERAAEAFFEAPAG